MISKCNKSILLVSIIIYAVISSYIYRVKAKNPVSSATQLTLQDSHCSGKPEKGRHTILKESSGNYFGYDFFETFQQISNKSVDDDYVVNSGDILRLTVWGLVEFQYRLDVDEAGRVFIPNLGRIKLGNMRLVNARIKLKQKLAQKYRGLTKSPQTIFMDLSVESLKPIEVYILGEVKKPGKHIVNGPASALSALYICGGPKQTGSLRNIKVVRNGAHIGSLDIYNYIMTGDQKVPAIQLQDSDKIYVPLRGKTVQIQGCVKRPSTYEMKADETLRDLIDFSGGFTNNAFTNYLQIRRVIPPEERIRTRNNNGKKVIDLSFSKILKEDKKIKLVDGDRIRILCSTDELDNYVVVQGAVVQPDTSELDEFPSNIRELVKHAGGLLDEAYLKRAELYRLNEDRSRKLISLNLKKALAGHPDHNITLKKQDILKVFTKSEIKNRFPVYISGPVKNPGRYQLIDNMKISDLLFKAGGLWDQVYRKKIYLQRASLIRRLDDGVNDTTIAFNLKKAIAGHGFGKTLLQPYDSLIIYPQSINKFPDKHIRVSGFVKDPGKYSYTRNMTLTDAILTAGGFEKGAFLEKIEVNRLLENNNTESATVNYRKIIIKPGKVKAAKNIDNETKYNHRIMKKSDSFKLQPGDIIRVKKLPGYAPPNFVNISGRVFFPGEYTLLKDKESLYHLIKRAGGFKQNAFIDGIKLLRDSTYLTADFKKALRFKDDKHRIILKAGDEIYIPDIPNRIRVNGNVGSQGIVQFIKGKNLFYYIRKRGGLKPHTENVYLIYPNNEIRKIPKLFGIYLCNPKVPDGAEIRATQKEN